MLNNTIQHSYYYNSVSNLPINGFSLQGIWDLKITDPTTTEDLLQIKQTLVQYCTQGV
jgi:hypothetical protein